MNVYDRFIKVQAIILDIDGVCTDNRILVTDHGEFLRSMNVKDGYAIKRAIHAGIKMAIISGGRSNGTRLRFELLGIKDIHLGIEHKYPSLVEILRQWNISADNTAYMGDDIPDLEVMSKVGLAACPADSAPEILKIANYISPLNGGNACVRDLIEKVLQAQGKW
ncbi:MAG: HAD-IIIA family hydrolase [Saprospiraceae bacterium]|nr:HAD-IIIA family hydrolase [Saprospiraceae bacterium]